MEYEAYIVARSQ